jgi:leucyl/phenylalanyl-tRNA--protein transferase
MPPSPLELTWLEPGDPFPSVDRAWNAESDAPGLLAAGGSLDVETLRNAYAHGIFPWFGKQQPILWWSPDPRMVLDVKSFRLHRSLRKKLARFKNDATCEIRFDTAFLRVIQSCADASRRGQPGTWILPPMVDAYYQLHLAGNAHSIETWINGELVGGLYCVAIGRAVFGESMFAKIPDASKIALASLVAFSRANGIALIDCQQNTAHLASLGAAEIPRALFLSRLKVALTVPPLVWKFEPLYWQDMLQA